MEKLYENAGEMTRRCLDSLLWEDYSFLDEDYSDEYLLTYPFKSFSDGLTEIILKHGYTGNLDSVEDKANFVKECCQKNNVSLNIANIRRWFQNKRPISSEKSRELVFRLCFGLDMNIEEVTEFFLKVYFECPFNFRNHEEVIYYFCFVNHLDYISAAELKNKADLILKQSESEKSEYEFTFAIGSELKKIHTEQELLDYIRKNSSEFLVNNSTALKNAKKLLEECTALAADDFERHNFHDEEILHYSKKKSNVDLFLDVFLDINMTTYSGENSFAKLSVFPELIKSNFPLKMQLSKIKNGKQISYDAMRKALIVLNFYDYFAKLSLENKDNYTEQDFELFVEETNDLLISCGYPPFYIRNPFDWLIMHCANNCCPLDELRNAFARYFVDVAEDS